MSARAARVPGVRVRRAAALALAVAWAVAALAGCSASPRQLAAASVVGVGGLLAGVHAEHRRAYVEATDGLRERLVASGGSVQDYQRMAAPLTREFQRRGASIRALDAALYRAAALIQMGDRADGRDCVRAARAVFDELEKCVRVLGDGAVLRPVLVPPAVRDAARAVGLSVAR